MKQTDCNGLIYRFIRNVYINKTGDIVCNERFRKLKRISCSGCVKCDWLNECIHEDSGLPNWPENLISNQLYRLEVVKEYKDWETGIVDDFELGMIPYEEK